MKITAHHGIKIGPKTQLFIINYFPLFFPFGHRKFLSAVREETKERIYSTHYFVFPRNSDFPRVINNYSLKLQYCLFTSYRCSKYLEIILPSFTMNI